MAATIQIFVLFVGVMIVSSLHLHHDHHHILHPHKHTHHNKESNHDDSRHILKKGDSPKPFFHPGVSDLGLSGLVGKQPNNAIGANIEGHIHVGPESNAVAQKTQDIPKEKQDPIKHEVKVPGFDDSDVKRGILMVDPIDSATKSQEPKNPGVIGNQHIDVTKETVSNTRSEKKQSHSDIKAVPESNRSDKKQSHTDIKAVPESKDDAIKKDKLKVDPELKHDSKAQSEKPVSSNNEVQVTVSKEPVVVNDSLKVTTNKKQVPGFVDSDIKKGILTGAVELPKVAINTGLNKLSDPIVSLTPEKKPGSVDVQQKVEIIVNKA